MFLFIIFSLIVEFFEGTGGGGTTVGVSVSGYGEVTLGSPTAPKIGEFVVDGFGVSGYGTVTIGSPTGYKTDSQPSAFQFWFPI